MQRSGRNFWHLFLSIAALSFLGWFGNTFPPVATWQVVVFLTVTGISIYFSVLYLSRKSLTALALTGYTVLFLTLRYLGLHDWYYPLLLTAAAGSVWWYLKHL
ncbi:hypothetical protein A2Z33_06790 [Candidatus Gottesmanbacteria bacterium RBG_16_52_11]|uniref:Uncharacterized protein n=1 Tax=Candidatus Gottesmanbacteria bacterium RBG_16_52_11 TaxID=1798374 RepID=A0A1F5YXP4_9BACT|nr:MAG: hypothetical protein A2Z33_06790 [Candidatus Gottesmanbacteria bacterium RBG_16_52_11]